MLYIFDVAVRYQYTLMIINIIVGVITGLIVRGARVCRRRACLDGDVDGRGSTDPGFPHV